MVIFGINTMIDISNNKYTMQVSRKLKTGKAFMDNQDNIDVFIGSDYYWDIITGEVARGEDKLVACEPQTHVRSSLLSLRKIASANPSDKAISVT